MVSDHEQSARPGDGRAAEDGADVAGAGAVAGSDVAAAPDADPDIAADPEVRPELPDLLSTTGTRRSLVVRILLGLAGALLVLLGVVVWITPLVSGAIPLYLAGAVLLGMADPRIARWINRHERRRLPYRARLWLRPKLRRQILREQAARRDDTSEHG